MYGTIRVAGWPTVYAHVLLQHIYIERGVAPCAVETLEQGTIINHLDLRNDVASVCFSRVAATRFASSLFESTDERLVGVSRCVPALRICPWLLLCSSSRATILVRKIFVFACPGDWDACAESGSNVEACIYAGDVYDE